MKVSEFVALLNQTDGVFTYASSIPGGTGKRYRALRNTFNAFGWDIYEGSKDGALLVGAFTLSDSGDAMARGPYRRLHVARVPPQIAA